MMQTAAKSNSLKQINMNSYTSAKTSGLDSETNLNEVVIINNYHKPTTYIYFSYTQPYFQYTSPTYSYNPYGVGGGGGSITPPPPPTTTPCDQIKNVMNYNPNEPNSLKSSLNWLKDKVNAPVNDKECGVEVQKKMNYDESYRYEFTQVLSNDEFSVPMLTGSNYIGGIHSHPANGYAMFSYQDVRFLLATYDGASSTRKEEVFNSVVCKDQAGNTNTYMLKIDNIDALRAQVNAVWNNPNYAKFSDEKTRIKAIHEDQSPLYEKNKGQLEKSFLEQFAAFGISIYKANTTLSSFSKLSLNNSSITSTPCN